MHEFHLTLYSYLVQVVVNELRMLLWVVSLHVKETEVSIIGGQESSERDAKSSTRQIPTDTRSI